MSQTEFFLFIACAAAFVVSIYVAIRMYYAVLRIAKNSDAQIEQNKYVTRLLEEIMKQGVNEKDKPTP